MQDSDTAAGDSRVAVWGAGGYIGRALVRRLRRDRAVLAVSRGTGWENRGGPGHELIDAGDRHPDLPSCLEGCRCIINLAGYTGKNRRRQESDNVAYQKTIRSLLPNHCPHLVHVSSLNVLFADLDSYGASKKRGEQFWEGEWPSDRLTIVRPSLVYGGPEDTALTELVSLLKRVPCVPLMAHGTLRPVYLNDLLDVLAAISRLPQALPEPLVISGEQELGYDQFLRMIAGMEGLRLRLVRIPPPLVQLAIRLLRLGRFSAAAGRLACLQLEKSWHDPLDPYLRRSQIPLSEGTAKTLAGKP